MHVARAGERVLFGADARAYEVGQRPAVDVAPGVGHVEAEAGHDEVLDDGPVAVDVVEEGALIREVRRAGGVEAPEHRVGRSPVADRVLRDVEQREVLGQGHGGAAERDQAVAV